MHFERAIISDLVIITPKRFGDDRGHFMETFREDLFQEQIGSIRFVQDNQSFSALPGTVRGLHFQLEPRAQGKLVRCSAGALLDVAVDIRVGSPTYGKHVAVELSAENGKQLWVPTGFAHGFCTLIPNTEISYKVTDYYSAENDRGLQWDDPELEIAWPVKPEDACLSLKDRQQPKLSELGEVFSW